MSNMVLRSHTRAARQKQLALGEHDEALVEKPKMATTRGLFEVTMNVGRWKFGKNGFSNKLHVLKALLVRIPGKHDADPEYDKEIEDYGQAKIPRPRILSLHGQHNYFFNFRLPLPRDSSWSTLLVSNRTVRNSKGNVAILFLTAARDIGEANRRGQKSGVDKDQKGQIVSLLGSFIQEPNKVGIFVPQEINLNYGRFSYGPDQGIGSREASPVRIDLMSYGPRYNGWILLCDEHSEGWLGFNKMERKMGRHLINAADYDMDEPVWDNAEEDFIEFEMYQGKAQKENESLSPSFVRRARPHVVYERPWSSPQGLSDNNFLYSFNMGEKVGKLRLDPHAGTIETFPDQPAYRDWALALMSSSDKYLGENGGFDDTVGPINGLNNDPAILIENTIKPAQPKNRLHEGTSRSTCCFVDETTGGFMQ